MNAVAQKLHASISPKDQSSTNISRREIASNKALQNQTSTLDPTQAVDELDSEVLRDRSEIMECRSIILNKCESDASSRFRLSELIKSAYRPDKIF